jgi:hypothetical protein
MKPYGCLEACPICWKAYQTALPSRRLQAWFSPSRADDDGYVVYLNPQGMPVLATLVRSSIVESASPSDSICVGLVLDACVRALDLAEYDDYPNRRSDYDDYDDDYQMIILPPTVDTPVVDDGIVNKLAKQAGVVDDIQRNMQNAMGMAGIKGSVKKMPDGTYVIVPDGVSTKQVGPSILKFGVLGERRLD